MIRLRGERLLLCESVADLPDLAGARTIFVDAETRRPGDDVAALKGGAFNPYLGDRACGWAITVDDDPRAFYVPVRHRDERWNLPVDNVNRWLRGIIARAERWVNHNVKFDAAFALVDGIEIPDALQMWDTSVDSKLIDSDRMNHKLKELARSWLGASTGTQDRVQAFLDGYRLPRNNKAGCYGLVPADILGEYACDDVLFTRDLLRYCDEKMPEQCGEIRNTERLLTPVLFDMERRGLQTDDTQLKTEKARCLHKMLAIGDRIHEITGLEYVDSNPFMYDLLVNQLGLPVLARDRKTGNPTFNADALKLYRGHPQVAVVPERAEIMDLILDYRREETYHGLYVDAFLEKRDENGRVHPQYNQVVRTGRMSSKQPNGQQLSSRAKALIHPDGAFLSTDASQIEFRIIVHYIRDEQAIEAYRKNPRIDFHTWVSELCHIARRPAKNVNFAMAFRAGKRRILSMLAAEPEIIAEIGDRVDAMIEAGEVPADDRIRVYGRLCQERAIEVYETYHERLPGIQTTARRSEAMARGRGYVFNVFGRRRHLPRKGAHKAFNALVQSSAMDYIKRCMVALAPRYNRDVRDLGLELAVNVHDELLFDGPAEAVHDPRTERLLGSVLNGDADGLLRVPIVWDFGRSDIDWKEAAA